MMAEKKSNYNESGGAVSAINESPGIGSSKLLKSLWLLYMCGCVCGCAMLKITSIKSLTN